MPSKLTYYYVRNELSKAGWTLLQGFYSGAREKMKCKCPNGHIVNIRWNYFKNRLGKNVVCPKCNRLYRYTLNEVYDIFKSKGFILLAKEYKNNKQKLKCKCLKCSNIQYIRLNDLLSGIKCKYCNNKKGPNNPNWKGGITMLGLPLYDTYYDKLEPYLDVYKINVNGLDVVAVKCFNKNCNNIFVPTRSQIKHKLESINNVGLGDNNLYCSDKCKQTCSIYKVRKYPKYYRKDQKFWADKIKSEANNKCELCGSTGNLIAHHEVPVKVNGLISLDLDNGICLCKSCHSTIHKLPWCTLSYLRSCEVIYET